MREVRLYGPKPSKVSEVKKKKIVLMRFISKSVPEYYQSLCLFIHLLNLIVIIIPIKST